MNYRREIDGLRAVAVLPVILFHAGFPLFGGGFVGVDVFFVISGFLITGIIVEEMRHGRFSLLNFYERRARRILPALFLVMAASLPAAWMLLSPKDLQDFAQSLVAIGLFASNFLFWQESGYFDTEAELKPMLHTWSLAVEEQYYVIFPLMILVCWRLGPARLFALLATLAAASLALSQWQVQTQPITAFFLLPSRALHSKGVAEFYAAAGGYLDLFDDAAFLHAGESVEGSPAGFDAATLERMQRPGLAFLGFRTDILTVMAGAFGVVLVGFLSSL